MEPEVRHLLLLLLRSGQRGERAADGFAIAYHIPAGQQPELPEWGGDGTADNGHDLNSRHRHLQRYGGHLTG